MSENSTLTEHHFPVLKAIVRNAPGRAGVYFWKDAEGLILYVGKAVNLKNRLTSYFNDKSLKTRHLLSKAMSVEWLVVDNEYEALVLENNLIKKNQPRYNIQLKDQKTYPHIRITGEQFPRVFRTRTIVQDGSEYFGPYPGVDRVDLYLNLIKKVFKLRKCTPIPLKKKSSPCLYYHMGQCLGPCCGLVSEEEYKAELNKVRSLLMGKINFFVRDLTKLMNEAAANLEYEKAAQIRDAIQAVKISGIEQKVEDKQEERRDYLGFAGREGLYCFVILRMREGRMIDKASFKIESPADSDEAFNEFIIRYYSDVEMEHRPEIVFVENIPHQVDYNRFFREENSSNIRLNMPIEERDVKLLRMAFENATLDLMRQGSREDALKDLKESLDLPRLPRRIEGFDIAQLNGHFTVASLISFHNGLPDKKNYRRFRMKSLKDGEIDDFKSISEAVARRFTRILNEGLELPDLLLIDGGKGQVSSAYSVLKALGLENQVPLAGLAKREEEIFRPGQKDPIILQVGSPALRLCQAVRDETHRFATTYNQKLRASTLSLTHLESVKGIGPRKARSLLKEFGSLQSIARQPANMIANTAKISLEKANELIEEIQNVLDNEEK